MDQEGRREQYSILKVPNIAWIDGKGAPPHNDGLVVSEPVASQHSDARECPDDFGAYLAPAIAR